MTTVSVPRTVPAPAPPVPAAGTRDTAIDLLRAFCVLGVVVLHALMVGVTVADAGPVFTNASEGTDWIAPVSWVLQVMPLFFVIGGFSGFTAYRRSAARGGTALSYVAGRVHRLLMPAVATIATAGVALALLAASGVAPDLLLIAGYRFGQPLWFLAVFLMCQALLPLFAALHARAPLLTLGMTSGMAVLVDAVRGATGIDGIGYINLAFVWLALQQLGFFLADGGIDRLDRRLRQRLLVGAIGVLVTGMLAGLYSPDLIAQINPPTTALLLVGLAHTLMLSLHRDRIRRWSTGALLARFHRFVTARAMTIYLWHMPVLLAMSGIVALLSVDGWMVLPEPSSAAWWLSRPLWVGTAIAATAIVATLLARLEARRARPGTESPWRMAFAVVAGLLGVVLLLVTGTTPLTAAASLVLLGTALRLARVVAT